MNSWSCIFCKNVKVEALLKTYFTATKIPFFQFFVVKINTSEKGEGHCLLLQNVEMILWVVIRDFKGDNIVP